MSEPGRQICPICAHDEVDILSVDGDWIMVCDDGCHPGFEWQPTMQKTGLTYRSGIGEELGVYETLLSCVFGGMVEYGVIEYRFAERDPATYQTLIERYGHRALAPSAYTASSFLGGALGQLWREQLISGWIGKATGYWSYNSRIGIYGPAGIEPPVDILTWESFAGSQQLDPEMWPPLAEP